MTKNKGGRPSIKSWDALLQYKVVGSDEKFKPLKNAEGGLTFDNFDLAIEALENLQIPNTVEYIILLMLNDTSFIMEPAEPAKIRYMHKEAEEQEDDDNVIPEEEEDNPVPEQDDLPDLGD